MLCPTCNAAIPAIAKFCPECGTALAQIASAPNPIETEGSAERAEPASAPPRAGTVALRMAQRTLKEVIALVQYAMAQQDNGHPANGLQIVIEDGALRVAATDGHRVALASRPIATQGLDRQEIIVPRHTILELSQRLAHDDQPVEVVISAHQVRFVFGGRTLVAKPMEGRFPAVESVVPKHPAKPIVLPRAALQQGLQRLAIGSSDAVCCVRWALAPGRLTISGTSPAQRPEAIEIDYAGEPLEIGFNAGYLLDLLAALEGDMIECSFGGATTPGVFRMAGRDDFQCVLMPIRL